MKDLIVIRCAQLSSWKSIWNGMAVFACCLMMTGQVIGQEEIGLEVSSKHAVLFGDSLYGYGIKSFWLPEKGAFRAGLSSEISNPGDPINFDNSWDSINIGILSTSFGVSNFSKGHLSMSWGERNKVEGVLSTSWGSGNEITSDASASTVWGLNNESHEEAVLGTAWGMANTISARGATAWGQGNSVDSSTAEYSTVWGIRNRIEGESRGTVWGNDNVVSGRGATAWGSSNDAVGENSTSFGNDNHAGGYGATALGVGNTANGYATTTIGLYADSIGNEQVGSNLPNFGTADYPLFVVGNGNEGISIGGPAPIIRSNALVVSKSGRLGVNTDFLPGADLHIKLSGTGTNSKSGIRIDEPGSEEPEGWRISIAADGGLLFLRNNGVVAKLLPSGLWQADGYTTPGFITLSRQLKTSIANMSNLKIGQDTNGKIAIDGQSVLDNLPSAVTKDEEGKPQSIDYQQLYLLAISTIQDQDKTIRKQQVEIQSHDKRLLQLEQLIKDK